MNNRLKNSYKKCKFPLVSTYLCGNLQILFALAL